MIGTIRPWLISITLCLTLGIGWMLVLNRANPKLEAKCLHSGGTVITNLGKPSMCIQPS
jgi:hypothetical protein